MTPFLRATGRAVPLIENDLNTDELAPGMGGPPRPGKSYAAEFLRNRRVDSDGNATDFILNQPRFQTAAILVSGSNFGCGSSRETAVWALKDFGIRCVVARSFADAFRENCLRNGVLPVALDDPEGFEQAVVSDDGAGEFTADLESCRITAPDGRIFAFAFPDAERRILLEGLDEIAMTQAFDEAIAAWEDLTRAERPWLQRLKPTEGHSR